MNNITVNLYAPSKWWELTPHQRKKISNGCGPRVGIGDLIPDSILYVSITEACRIHDYMYKIGKTEDDKEHADLAFLNNMVRLINAESKCKLLKRVRLKLAKGYYKAVAYFGGPAFYD